MPRNLTFGKKIGLGFASIVAITLAIGLVSVHALRSVVAGKDRVIDVDAHLMLEAEHLQTLTEHKSAASRGFLLSREERFMDQLLRVRGEFADALARLERAVDTAESRAALDAIGRAEADHNVISDRLIALRRGDATLETVGRFFDEQVVPLRLALNQAVSRFVDHQQRIMDEARRDSTTAAGVAVNLVLVMIVGALLAASILGFFLTKTLTRQIGGAVGQVQSSSSELQAAASQQATGSKEQATAMSEISTTISELLATSRQIAESAQRVAHVAKEAAGAARGGEGTVETSHESISGIRRQVDLIVNHMLELGKKSQQIGAVLEIVSELAEQTNILAVNATIEAAGAGESGKRFATVADEIRKLADRVAGSAKEIRGLIDDIRGAVNTTVMATESGSKAVDAGSRQFVEVSAAFKQIAGLLSTTSEAAREIELSTKQQTTAVEQVNLAIANVAQATRETEASSSQTLQTASQLTTLSRDLLVLVQRERAA